MCAGRLGTGRPSNPTCVPLFDVAKPSAPAASASRSNARMLATSAGVASRSVASGPITYSRSGVWPSIAPTLIAVPPASIASRNCGKLSNDQSAPMPACSASSDMPSTFSSVCKISLRCAGRVGAMPKPQLPITTLVTPCHGEIVSMRSHSTCAS